MLYIFQMYFENSNDKNHEVSSNLFEYFQNETVLKSLLIFFETFGNGQIWQYRLYTMIMFAT